MEAFIVFLILMIVGYTSGKFAEKRHYRSIEAREQEFRSLPAVTMKNALEPDKVIAKAELVSGSIVVSIDYFKRFLAGLRNFFGGRVKSYESLLDRGRREAILRMKEEAKGANIILNLRLETASISKGAKKTVGSVEVIAYGTAVTYKKGITQKIAPDTRAQPVVEKRPKPAPDKISAPVTAKPETDERASAEQRYKVIFSGELVPGQELEKVKAKVAALYKVPVEQCESLFRGRPVIIKDNLDYQTAQKYKKAFENTGAICQIEPIQ